MTTEEFLEFKKEIAQRSYDICKQKNADYTADSGNAFKNFMMVEEMGICSTEDGFLTRMTDKMMRVTSFVKKGTLEVKSESVEDTLMDLSNYAELFMGYLKWKRESKHLRCG